VKKILLVVFSVFLVGAIVIARFGYKYFLKSNVYLSDHDYAFYIQSDSANYEEVRSDLVEDTVIINKKTFDFVANKLHYNKHIHPGKYLIKPGMNNLELVRLLRSGKQTPVNFVLNKVRLKEDFAQVVGKYMEADSVSMMNQISNEIFLDSLGYNEESIMCMIIPNTYEFWWNTSAKSFLLRMKKEHDAFWTESRIALAEKIGLTENEVYILASIVEEEYKMPEERTRIAGVFLNRINNRWSLQADATLKFALKNFELKRVLNIHKEIDSPYNTYKYPGLPPGPICTPSITTIDAVLNSEKHKYFYYCAKEDLSGYHNFAATLAEHQKNALNYQKALNQLNIR